MGFLKQLLLEEQMERDREESCYNEILEITEEINQYLKAGELTIHNKHEIMISESVDEVSRNNPLAASLVSKQKNHQRNLQNQTNSDEITDSERESIANYLSRRINTDLGTVSTKTDHTLVNDLVWQYSLTLSPGTSTKALGFMPCCGAINCIKNCLINSGQAPEMSKTAGDKRFEMLVSNHEGFMAMLGSDLKLITDAASKMIQDHKLQGVMCRLNNMSDIPITFFSPIGCENIDGIDMYYFDINNNITKQFPSIQFIDYTKVYVDGEGTQELLNGNETTQQELKKSLRFIKRQLGGGNMDIYKNGVLNADDERVFFDNYYCVYSYDGESNVYNAKNCRALLDDGEGIAVIFYTYGGKLPIPTSFPFDGKYYKVIIGDFSDTRHLDRARYGIGKKEGYIVALSYKNNTTAGANNDEAPANAIDLMKYYYDLNIITREDAKVIAYINEIEKNGETEINFQKRKKFSLNTQQVRERIWNKIAQHIEVYDYSATIETQEKSQATKQSKQGSQEDDNANKNDKEKKFTFNKDHAYSTYSKSQQSWKNYPYSKIMGKK